MRKYIYVLQMKICATLDSICLNDAIKIGDFGWNQFIYLVENQVNFFQTV